MPGPNKMFGPKKMPGPKRNIGFKKKFWSKKFLVQIFFMILSPNEFYLQKYLGWKKKLLSKKNVG